MPVSQRDRFLCGVAGMALGLSMAAISAYAGQILRFCDAVLN